VGLWISEPSTLATDYLLGVIALVCAKKAWLRVGQQSSRRMWAFALGALACASFAGGTYHGFGVLIGERAATGIWKLTTMATGVASCFLLVAALLASFSGWLGRGLIAVAVAKLIIYLGWMLEHDGFVFVILDYGSTLLVVLALIFAGRLRGDPWCRAYIAGGIVISIAAAVVQQSGIRLHQHFNHNDVMHVIQMGGVWLLYRGGSRLRNAGGTDGGQS
jgi:hypothetical protein